MTVDGPFPPKGTETLVRIHSPAFEPPQTFGGTGDTQGTIEIVIRDFEAATVLAVRTIILAVMLGRGRLVGDNRHRRRTIEFRDRADLHGSR